MPVGKQILRATIQLSITRGHRVFMCQLNSILASNSKERPNNISQESSVYSKRQAAAIATMLNEPTRMLLAPAVGTGLMAPDLVMMGLDAVGADPEPVGADCMSVAAPAPVPLAELVVQGTVVVNSSVLVTKLVGVVSLLLGVVVWAAGAVVVETVAGVEDRRTVLVPTDLVKVTPSLPEALSPALMWKGLEYWKICLSLSSLKTRP